ncbi:MAG: hypothetical protein DYG94_12870 [Leptolyngbya sp. PLA3]|nr:MAG: hypothetical protein EDM82_12280 [Cyanobacteria bacterium CYA]MCE7969617.1 hypothetical protein [Leptolyngbya sp. PL-A3]
MVFALSAATALAQIDATYIGPWGGRYDDAANWDIGLIPYNTMTDSYNVFVPPSNYCYWQLMTGAYEVNDLTLGDQSYMDLYPDVDLTVLGDADYAGSYVRLLGGDLTLTNPIGLDNITPGRFRHRTAATGRSTRRTTPASDSGPSCLPPTTSAPSGMDRASSP